MILSAEGFVFRKPPQYVRAYACVLHISSDVTHKNSKSCGSALSVHGENRKKERRTSPLPSPLIPLKLSSLLSSLCASSTRCTSSLRRLQSRETSTPLSRPSSATAPSQATGRSRSTTELPTSGNPWARTTPSPAVS